MLRGNKFLSEIGWFKNEGEIKNFQRNKNWRVYHQQSYTKRTCKSIKNCKSRRKVWDVRRNDEQRTLFKK